MSVAGGEGGVPIYAEAAKISGPTSVAASDAKTLYPIKASDARISEPTSVAVKEAVIPTDAPPD
jgi:hypothetical protein